MSSKAGRTSETASTFEIISRKTNIWGEGSLGSIVGVSGAHPRVILVLCEYIWNWPVVSLVLPAFDGIGSLEFPSLRGIRRLS